MKAQELRIGNLIYWNIDEKLNVPHTVVGIRKDRPQTIPISLGNSIEDYSGIPINEEWLLKFGFEKTEKKNPEVEYERFLFTKGVLEFYLHEGRVIPAPYYFGNAFNELEMPIQYIHQIQNIAFVLTGKELTINNN